MRDTEEGRHRLAFVRKFAALRKDDDAFSTDATLEWIDNDAPDAILSYVKTSPDGRSRWFCAVNLTKGEVETRIAGRGKEHFEAAEWRLVRL